MQEFNPLEPNNGSGEPQAEPQPQPQPQPQAQPGPAAPEQTPPQMKSYTATPYDHYNVLYSDPSYATAPPPAPAPAKQRKTVSLSAAIITSVLVSLISSVLAFVVLVYGLGLSSQFANTPDQPTASASEVGHSTTNIVVDATAQTSAEAVAEKAGPSVVGIVVTNEVSHFFYGASSSAEEGSGIVYSADGYIITNYHVIQSAVESGGTAAVYLPSDSENAVTATVVGYDVSADLAVLKIDKTGLTPIEIGDSSAVKVGQTAIAIGNPGGMDFMGSVSMGIISGLDRTLQLENSATEIHLIQTDAAINPGNSGGALVDSAGKLIGINSAKIASEQYEGMGFAIPVNDAVTIVERIIDNIDAPKPYLGVEISTYYDASTLQMMGYPAGVVVSGVMSGSPAEQAGLQRGDIITQFNDVAVTGYTQFNSEKAKYKPGDTVTVTVYRRGQTGTLSITMGTANE